MDGSHCCGGRAARGFISPAVIKFRACWPTFQLWLPLAGQAGHLRVRLPPAHLHSHCCCQESGLGEANQPLGICEKQFETSLAKRQPKPQGAKDNKELQLCEKKQIPADFAEIIKAGVHQTAHLDCAPWEGAVITLGTNF